MRAIHVSVRVAPVRGALSHGDHGNCTAPIKVLHYYYYYQVWGWCLQVDQYLVVGSVGGRLDHHYANVATLFKAAALTTKPIYLVSRGNLVCLLPRVS